MINWLAVLVSAIVAMALGALWHSRAMFGPMWAKLSKMTTKDMKASPKIYSIAFINSLIKAAILAVFISMTLTTGILAGIFLGFLVWLGFVATVSLSAVLWAKKPVEVYLIEVGYELLAFVVMGIILAVW
jgi:hypothetical protein